MLIAQALRQTGPLVYEVRRSGIPVELTRIEFQLLLALLRADGRVLTRDRLLDALYGQDAIDVLDRTIDVHVRRLRDKLEIVVFDRMADDSLDEIGSVPVADGAVGIAAF